MPVCFDQLQLVEPSLLARRLWWHVFSLGRVWRDEVESHPAMDKAGLFLFWVVSGRGVLQSGREICELSQGPCCWLADMALPRTYLPAAGTTLTTHGIRFSGPGLEAWREVLTPGVFRFRVARQMGFLAKVQSRLSVLIERRPAGYEWQVHETLTLLIGRLIEMRKAWPAAVHEPPKPVARVLDAVLSEPSRAWRAGELAAVTRVSYSGLREMFRMAQQETLADFLQRIRLDQARLLLADERLPVKEIARRLNFTSEAYFSQWFHRRTQMNPTQFRRTLRL